jgi:hypothetical protein
VLSVAYGVQVADKLCAQRAFQIAGFGDEAGVSAPLSKVKDLPVVGQSAVALTKVGYVADDDKLDEAIALAERCQKGYDTARAGLIAAAEAVDAWGDIEKSEQVACGAQEGVTGLNYIVEALEVYGVKMPPAVADAQVAATFVAGLVEMKSCKMPEKK